MITAAAGSPGFTRAGTFLP